MAEMYLTDKLMGQNLDGHSSRMSLDGIDEFSSQLEHNNDSDVEEDMYVLIGFLSQVFFSQKSLIISKKYTSELWLVSMCINLKRIGLCLNVIWDNLIFMNIKISQSTFRPKFPLWRRKYK